MIAPSWCEYIPPWMRWQFVPCAAGQILQPGGKGPQRPSVPLPQSWALFLVGAILIVVLYEFAPKLAGWILLALVLGFVLVGPGSTFFSRGFFGGHTPQIGGSFP